MIYKECKINLPKKIYEDFEQFISELPIEGYFELLFDPTIPKNPAEGIISDNTTLSVYLSQNDMDSEVKILIFLKIHAPDDFFLESKLLETKDYEESYKEFYSPFEIGNFYIIPTWEKEKNITQKINLIPLYLNPGLAFGTGHHETTKLMLERISQIDLSDKSVLDIGTGSGILSIAASLSGARNIIAVDIDPNSVKATEFNWEQNTNSHYAIFSVYEGGFDHPIIKNYEFDILLANITYAVISQNIHSIANLRTNHFLFSGITIEKKDVSLDLFSKALGGKLVYEKNFNDWLIIEWQR